MNKRLFVDDLRFPTINHAYMSDELRKPFYDGEWELVRHYDDFIKWIETNGLPEFLSLDHDLEYCCVVENPVLVNDNEICINQQCKYDKNQPNGVACAKWLIDYCEKRNIELPPYQCHSQNQMGKATILWVLDNYKKQIYR